MCVRCRIPLSARHQPEHQQPTLPRVCCASAPRYAAGGKHLKCFTSASAQTFISSFSFRTPAPPGRHHRETGARVGARGVGGRRAGVLLRAQDAATERRGQPTTRQSFRPKAAKTVLTRKTWHPVFQDLFLVEGNLGRV